MIAQGETVTVGGETVYLGSNGVVIVAAGPPTTASFGRTALPISGVVEVEVQITIGSTIRTAFQLAGHSGIVVMDGTTLSVGGLALTASGETVSLSPSGIVTHVFGETGSKDFGLQHTRKRGLWPSRARAGTVEQRKAQSQSQVQSQEHWFRDQAELRIKTSSDYCEWEPVNRVPGRRAVDHQVLTCICSLVA
ncbi:hypothetical protein B0A55_01701 [Friedmanniomyces simplex]|uniref:Uncharacterized protein n=1 Tax=Friedmanniomyces simplex TaxID=329884 RepID=A0A4U0XWM3_9PEZI|nr:hypothetical protein B0A55_01701 [Friedmanniomyces simplex]